MHTPMEVQKERAVLRCRRLRRAAMLSRWLLEALAALALLSWSSDHLPTALAVCATLLRRLPAVLFHPASAFVLGNLIVVTLLAKSGDHPAEIPISPFPPSPSTGGDVLHHPCYHSYVFAAPPPQLHREEEEVVVVYEDKAVCEESTTTIIPAATDYCSEVAAVSASPKKGHQKGLRFLRTRSSDLPIAAAAKVRTLEKLLRRSETYVGPRQPVAQRWRPEAEEEGGGRRQTAAAEDDNEEFRRRIETFISKQLSFIESEEESLAANGATGAIAVVVAGGGPDYHRRR